MPCPIVINEEEEFRQTRVGTPYPFEVDPVPEPSGRVAAVEESEFVIPLAEGGPFVPMAYAVDESEIKKVVTFLDWWMSFFKGGRGPAEETPPATEESEAYDPGRPPAMREDRHYHHQYPGCPYTGCPYTGRCPQPIREVLPVEQPAKPKKAGQEPEPIGPPHVESESQEPPDRPEARRSLRLSLPRAVGPAGDECPTHFEVDTTECRRSDLRWNVQGPIPF